MEIVCDWNGWGTCCKRIDMERHASELSSHRCAKFGSWDSYPVMWAKGPQFNEFIIY